jgi:hypothetical protein
MFIWTALDESTDRYQKYAYVVAGLLTSQQNWSSIERAWKKRLEKDGLTYFKTSEYRGLKGEFLRFKNEELYPKPTGRKAAREILNDLKLILKSEDIVGLGLAINLQDYRKARRSSKVRKFLPTDPYQLAYEIAMVAIAMHIGHGPYPQVVAFLCDQHSKATRLQEGYESLQKANPTAANYMGSLTVADDKKWAAIQLSDLVASICKDYFVKYFNGTISDQISALQDLRAEVGNHISLFFIDELAIKRIVAGNMLHNGRPSIRSSRQGQLFGNMFKLGSQKNV